MFNRILALKNLTKISKHILATHQLLASRSNTLVQPLCWVHVKTYDKDAGLDTKRAINVTHLEELGKEDNQNVLLQKGEGEIRANGVNSLQKSNIKTVESVYGEIVNDPDVFGNAPKEPIAEDEGDLEEDEYISRPTRHSKKLQTREYAMMIKDHLRNHRVKEAIDVLEKRMLKEDRVKPENYIYNLLISGCAKAGYTRKAFDFYTKMRQRGLKVKESTYTSLFNACANAPTREDGLTKAIRLRESLLASGYEFNVKNYNVMIKTFGHWGDVKTAYILADEMKDKNLEMTVETFNFLLQACAGDEKHGFRHCVLTWHKMLNKNLQPDYYTFHNVLRCTRDCGFGNLKEMEDVLQKVLEGKPEKIVIQQRISNGMEYVSEADDNNLTSKDNSLTVTNESTELELPNLLAAKPHLGSMVSLSEVQKPHERFLLLGGLTGFLELMKSKNITPNIQLFTTMLEVIPPTKTAEKQLLTFIRKIGLKVDIDFFNILIKKRAMRSDYEGGKEVLSMIHTAGLHPDIVTYGVLALGCTKVESSRELLEQMRHNGYRMNIQILGAMLKQGCFQKSFSYICEIMQISLDENIKPNEIFLRHLHNFHLGCARAIDARVLLLLYEKNIEFTPYIVDLVNGEQYSNWYLNLNPKADVPVLQDGTCVIPDSFHIINYIENKFRGGDYKSLKPNNIDSLEYDKMQLYEQILGHLPIGAFSLGSFIHDDLKLVPKPPFIGPIRKSCLRNNEKVYGLLKESIDKVDHKVSLLAKLDLQDRRKRLVHSRLEYQKILDAIHSVLKFAEDDLVTHPAREWLVSNDFCMADVSFGLLLLRLYQLGFENYFWSYGKLPRVESYFLRFKKRQSYEKLMPTNFEVLKDMWQMTPSNYIIGASAGVLGMAVFAVIAHK